MTRSIKVRIGISMAAGLWALLSLVPIVERPFEIFVRTRARAHREEFQVLLDRAQERVDEQKNRTLYLALLEMGEKESIDYARFFPDVRLGDIKNLKKRNKLLLYTLLKEPQSVFRQGLDLKGGVSFALQICPQVLEGKSESERRRLVQKAIDVIRLRIDALGVAEPIIRPKGQGIVEVQLPGLSLQDNPDVVQSLKKPAKLEFRLVYEGEGALPMGYERLIWEREDGNSGDVSEIPMGVKRIPEMTGRMVKSAVPVVNSYGQYEISLQMTPEGTTRFASVTRKNLHKPLAIVLDGKIYSAPVIQSEINNGQASISGRFTQREAIDLANVLNNPLEFELDLVETCEIGPSLAQDFRQTAYQGAWIGVFFVILFLIFYYRGPGVIAMVTLVFNFLLILGAWGAIGATITLPSITALALTFGMAVDANILIFERIREELRRGKALMESTLLGHHRAFTTILDSNVTTLIAAFLLIKLGSGSVKGFGVTLAIGIFTSMFAVLVFNRALLEWLVRFNVIRFRPSSFWSQLNVDFMKFRKKAFLGSISLIFVGLTAFFIRGNRIYGIDFLGGDELSFAYTHPIDHEAIHSVAKSHRLGEVGSVYQKHFAEGKTVHFLKIQTEWGRGMEVLKVLQEQFPESNLELISQNTIGSSVSREVQHNVFVSIGVALVGMLLYIAFRFEFGYGVGAIVALIHDTLITVGLYILWGRQFSAPMIAAILMVIGYSINDTIVIFDRIREELSLNPHKTLYQVINISINETLSRTFFTSLTTFFPAGIMAFYCSGVVGDYSLVFAMGVFVGTFSSIFIASPLFYAWHRGSRKSVEATRDTSPVYEWMKE